VKLHEKIFLIFVFFLPSQLAIHFWPDWSFIFGIRIDYLSPTLYFSQILLAITFSTFLIEEKLLFTKRFVFPKLAVVGLLGLLPFLSTNPLVTLSRLPILFSACLLFWYVRSTRERAITLVSTPFLASFFLVTALTVLQFTLKHSVGGVFTLLGERPLSTSTPGIALVSLFGVDYLRPYATFPHPNALAGTYLLLVLGLFPFLSRNNRIVSILLLSVVIVLTFSQTVWVALLLIPVWILLSKRLPRPLLSLSVLLFLCASIVSGMLPVLASYPKEIAERLVLAHRALITFANHPFGVGFGAGILFSPRTLIQPVHNVYLYTALELGIGGLIVLCLTLMKILLHARLHIAILVLTVMTIGLADHYLVSLLQPVLALSLLAGLTSSPSSTKVD
jgi:hypothetical protein